MAGNLVHVPRVPQTADADIMTLLSGMTRAARALRYWRNQNVQRRENGRLIDKSALLADARNMQPGLDGALTRLRRDGVAVIENYWSRDRCEAARREIDRLMESSPGCVHRFSADSDKRMFGIETAGDNCRAFHD